MMDLSPDQIDQILGAIVEVEASESPRTLKEGAVAIISQMLTCSHEDATTILSKWESERRLEIQLTSQSRQLNQQERMPTVRFKWGRRER